MIGRWLFNKISALVVLSLGLWSCSSHINLATGLRGALAPVNLTQADDSRVQTAIQQSLTTQLLQQTSLPMQLNGDILREEALLQQKIIQSLPPEISLAAAQAIESNPQVLPELEQAILQNITQQLAAQKSLGAVQLNGQILLPPELPVNPELVFDGPVLAATPAEVFAPSVGWVVQAIAPDGQLLGNSEVSTDGHYSIANVPTGMRIILRATALQLEQTEVLALADVPVGVSGGFHLPLTPESTAVARIVRNSLKEGRSQADRIPVADIPQLFAAEVEPLSASLALSLSQPLLAAELNQPTESESTDGFTLQQLSTPDPVKTELDAKKSEFNQLKKAMKTLSSRMLYIDE